jgi:hypothetical protein
MPDIAMELSHLDEADRHVALAGEQLSVVKRLDLSPGAARAETLKA